jgi:hypothetical protein
MVTQRRQRLTIVREERARYLAGGKHDVMQP